MQCYYKHGEAERSSPTAATCAPVSGSHAQGAHTVGGYGHQPQRTRLEKPLHSFCCCPRNRAEQSANHKQKGRIKGAMGCAKQSDSPHRTCGWCMGVAQGASGAKGPVLSKAPAFSEAPFPCGVPGSARPPSPRRPPRSGAQRAPRASPPHAGGFTMTKGWLPSAIQRPAAGWQSSHLTGTAATCFPLSSKSLYPDTL